MTKIFFKLAAACAAISLLASCGSTSVSSSSRSKASKMVVSVADQRLVVFDHNGEAKKSYPVSTSKFGLGDTPGSKKTPLGTMVVREKVGGSARPGTVFKGRKPTGEVIRPNSPGRDPIVSRILWLGGTGSSTKNAYRRYIYIHGTAEEWRVGQPASYGCIRMRSKDVIDLYDTVGVGSTVHVKTGRLYTGEIPGRDQMLVKNLRRRSSLGMGSGEVLAAADVSNRPPAVRRSYVAPERKRSSSPPPTRRKVAPKPAPAQRDPSQRRGMFDR